MTATARMTPPKFCIDMPRSGFRFHTMTDTMTAAAAAYETSRSPEQILTAAFHAPLSATDHPSGPVDTMVSEAFVHSEDIRRPTTKAAGYAHTQQAPDAPAAPNAVQERRRQPVSCPQSARGTSPRKGRSQPEAGGRPQEPPKTKI